jgi:hypothetical protein
MVMPSFHVNDEIKILGERRIKKLTKIKFLKIKINFERLIS